MLICTCIHAGRRLTQAISLSVYTLCDEIAAFLLKRNSILECRITVTVHPISSLCNVPALLDVPRTRRPKKEPGPSPSDYQLGMVEEVRQNLEKANERACGRGKVLRYYDFPPPAQDQQGTVVSK